MSCVPFFALMSLSCIGRKPSSGMHRSGADSQELFGLFHCKRGGEADIVGCMCVQTMHTTKMIECKAKDYCMGVC